MECIVELVGANRELVVIARSEEAAMEDCVVIFHRVISCVMEAKAEFCHSIKPQYFLPDSTDDANYLSDNISCPSSGKCSVL